MDTQHQLTVFCLSVCIGFCCGILYEAFYLLRMTFGCVRGKNKTLGGIFDVAFCLCFAIACIFAAHAFDFPDFRVYMCIGYGVGLIIYLKSLRRIVAFLQNLCYNKAVKLIKKSKKAKKSVKEGRTNDARQV